MSEYNRKKNPKAYSDKAYNQPDIDSQLEYMENFEFCLSQDGFHFCLHLETLIAVPQPAVDLDKHGRAHEEQQQETEAHVLLFLVERHNGKNIQHYVGQ